MYTQCCHLMTNMRSNGFLIYYQRTSSTFLYKSFAFSAVTWLKYCRYGVKLYPINQSLHIIMKHPLPNSCILWFPLQPAVRCIQFTIQHLIQAILVNIISSFLQLLGFYLNDFISVFCKQLSHFILDLFSYLCNIGNLMEIREFLFWAYQTLPLFVRRIFTNA